MAKWDSTDWFCAIFWVVLIGMFVGVIGWAVFETVNQIENEGRCDAINGELVAELDKCAVDDDLVPIPGG